MSNPHAQSRLPVIPRLIRVLSLPITLGWAFVAVALGVLSPSLDDVASQHSVPMTPRDAPAFKSMMHIGDKFNEFHTDSTAMVVLEEGQTRRQRARVLRPHRAQTAGRPSARPEHPGLLE